MSRISAKELPENQGFDDERTTDAPGRIKRR
jgi:hypothetical protein